MTKNATLYCDGGARGNPGPAGAGAVLVIDGKVVDKKGRYLGETTNNSAEYQGLLLGLELAQNNNIHDIDILLDSELVVKQVSGEYKVRHEGLKPLFEQVRIRLTHFKKWSIAHVPREKNHEADAMVNQAIDTRQI